jgi:hypothetical protein
MKPIWVLLALLAAFGIVGRIDYDVELLSAELRAEYVRQFAAQRAGVTK